MDRCTRDLLENKNVCFNSSIDSSAIAKERESVSVSAYLSLGATSASDSRGQGAWPTAALVAQLLTQMDGV